jgi:hypothetical protein
MMKAPEWMTNYTVQQEIAIAIRCIETALASVPRPSPTVLLTDKTLATRASDTQ